MAYFPDLTIYSYLSSQKEKGMINIGWLSKDHDFPKGEVPDKLVSMLFELSKANFNATRGFHRCEFCDYNGVDEALLTNKEALLTNKPGLGSAEIHVTSQDGKTYSAPNLICHYIAEHSYKPPDEFIDTVLSMDIQNAASLEEESQEKYIRSLDPTDNTLFTKIKKYLIKN